MDKITVLPTMDEEIIEDSTWCGTFQLVWNDFKNKQVGKDVTFEPEIELTKRLNKESFNENVISDEYYYKDMGEMTYDFKEKIEKEIEKRFNQKSDILDMFKWNKKSWFKKFDIILYVMLYRKFEFMYKFDKLDNGKFGNEEDVKYFGINNLTDKKARQNIAILYYNSSDDFAISLDTKGKDEVVLYKNPEGKTFNEIYSNLNKKVEEYGKYDSFTKVDECKIPYFEFNELKEYKELEGKKIVGFNKVIDKALQTIKFKIDEKGGEIKSEAAISCMKTAIRHDDFSEPRKFYVDNTFAVFLKEKNRENPYFAAKINNIKKFQ